MSKVIAVGQACLDILHEEGRQVCSFVGGRIANMAMALSHDGVGDMIVDTLKKNGVGVKSVDRFTEGQSQVSLIFRDKVGNERFSEYVKYPDSRFDVLWPKIEENDIVVFGSFFSVEESVRQPLSELLAYAQDRKAIIVYLPGFKPELCSRITRVMPAIVENLEVADVVIARESDMMKIFGKADARACYNEHIKFYCNNFLFSDSRHNVSLFTKSGVLTRESDGTPDAAHRLECDARLVARFVEGMLRHGLTRDGLDTTGADEWEDIMKK